MLAIVAALDHEIAPIRKRMDPDTRIHLKPGLIDHGHLGSLEVLLVRSGVGKAAMDKAVQFACKYYPVTSILALGYAGGTRPQLHLGDAVIPDLLIDAETRESWPISGPLCDLAIQTCEELQLRHHRGTSVCVATTIESPHEKAYLGTQFEAMSIEMEGSVLAQMARERGIPFAMVRAIVDPLDVALPHLPGPIVAHGVVRPGLFIDHLLRNPRQILMLPKLHYAATRARETVTELCMGICSRWSG